MSDITRKEVELMLENHAKQIELSSTQAECNTLRQENKDLITKLSSNEEAVSDIQEEVLEAVAEGAEANEGEPTELGKVLEKVAGLVDTVDALNLKVEEISSKFKDVLSSIKTVTPLEAGIGKMTMSSEGEEVVATDEEVEVAIQVLEKYFDTVGALPEVVDEAPAEDEIVDEVVEEEVIVDEASKKKNALSSRERLLARKKALASKKAEAKKKSVLASKRKAILAKRKEVLASKEVETLKASISAKKPSMALASKKQEALEKLRLARTQKIETSSAQEDNSGNYQAGELAGRLFSKNR